MHFVYVAKAYSITGLFLIHFRLNLLDSCFDILHESQNTDTTGAIPIF